MVRDRGLPCVRKCQESDMTAAWAAVGLKKQVHLFISFYYFIIITIIFEGMGIEHSSPSMLGKCSTMEVYSGLKCFLFFLL